MQITIDTARDELDDVLRLLSAAYGVEVGRTGDGGASAGVVAPAPSVEAAAGPASARGRRGGRRSGAAAERGPSRRARGRAASTSTAQIRAWARETGLDVPARGRLSAEVIAAYEQAHR
jgi:antitoxin (DNA-binding transcriptional repressor) of toxin-antitoxin stability system